MAGEGSYHGKEGWLVIASARGSNSAIHCNPGLYKQRHSPKWFMVRHSYIVCVEELEGMNIYDVLLVDSDFKLESRALADLADPVDAKDTPKHHFFTICNAERTFRLASESDRKMKQFVESIQMMKEITPWSKKHRFDSFAPVRYDVQCQWLVDGVSSLGILLIAARLFLECEQSNSQCEGCHLYS
jgi:phospholipase D1/2